MRKVIDSKLNVLMIAILMIAIFVVQTYDVFGAPTDSHKAAIGDTGYDTLQAAVEAAQEGDTIRLLGDVSENVTVSGKKLTLDLGTYTVSAAESGNVFTVTGSDISIRGGVIRGAAGKRCSSGIYASEQSVIKISETVITDNMTSLNSRGGGIFCEPGTDLTVDEAVFTDNYPNSIYTDTGSGDTNLSISNSVFSMARKDWGTRVYRVELRGNVTANFTGCSFSGYETAFHSESNNKKITIKDCVFEDNDLTTDNGRYAYTLVEFKGDSDIDIIGSRFRNNSSEAGNSNGGIIDIIKEPWTINIKDCIFTDNDIPGSDAVIKSKADSITMENTLIANNRAHSTGGLMIIAGTVKMKDTVVRNNTAVGVTTNVMSESDGTAGGISIVSEYNITGKLVFISGAIYDNELLTTYGDQKKANDVFVQGEFDDNGYTAAEIECQINADQMIDGDVDFSNKKWKDEDGSTFEDKPENYVADHRFYTIMDEYTGYVAQIGEKKYLTIPEAIEDAEDGDTILVIAEESNIDTDPLIVNKNLTIELAGHNLRLNRNAGDTPILTVENGGNLNVKNTKDDKYKNGGFSRGGITLSSGGSLTVADAMTVKSITHKGDNLTFGSVLSGAIDLRLGEGKTVVLGDPWKGNADLSKTTITVRLDPDVTASINAGGDDVTVAENAGEKVKSVFKFPEVTNDMVVKDIIRNDLCLHVAKGIYLMTDAPGSDDNEGLTPEEPVKTFEKALQMMEAHDCDRIFICGTVKIRNDEIWDGGDSETAVPIYRYKKWTGDLVDVSSNCKLTLHNIIIDGVKDQLDVGTGTLIRVNRNANLEITGDLTELRNNNIAEGRSDATETNTQGGAIKSEGNITMTGGTIHGNVAAMGGGIYQAYGTFDMSGGKIADNAAVISTGPQYPFKDNQYCGGGVLLVYNSTMKMHGDAVISGNSAENWGGGISTGNVYGRYHSGGKTKFEMYRDPDSDKVPKISDNDAAHGGGLYIQCQTTGKILDGEITGNSARGTKGFPAGGGIYVNGDHRKNYQSGRLFLSPVEMAYNTSVIDGSAVMTCSTSATYIRDIMGAVIHDNVSQTGPSVAYTTANMASSLGLYRDVDSNLSNYILGGGRYNWTYPAGRAVDAEELYNLYTYTSYKSEASAGDEDVDRAISLARVKINGNKAVNSGGGAIGNNGVTNVGSYGEKKDITVTKTWSGGSEDKIPSGIRIVLKRDGSYYDERIIEKDDDGNWPQAVFKDLLKYRINSDGSKSTEEYVYTIEEDMEYAHGDGKAVGLRYRSEVSEDGQIGTRYIETEDPYAMEVEGARYDSDKKRWLIPVPNVGFTVKNVYDPDPVEITDDPPVSKKVTGDETKVFPVFEFELTRDKSEYPMIDGVEGDTAVMQMTAPQKKEFGILRFTSPGTYTYTIRERIPDKIEGWTYDDSYFKLIYEISGDDTELSKKRVFEHYDGDGNLIGSSEDMEVEFVNTYEEPEEPTEPSTPTEPSKPTDPSDPTEPTAPTDPPGTDKPDTPGKRTSTGDNMPFWIVMLILLASASGTMTMAVRKSNR